MTFSADDLDESNARQIEKATHVHDYFQVMFSYATFWTCECGHQATEDEWVAWARRAGHYV